MRGLAGTLVFVGIVGAGLAFSAQTAPAHPPAKLTLEQERGVIEEIMAFRKTLAEAVAAKDQKKLRTLYADSFRHTHASGASDKKDAYIAGIVSGQPAIETAHVTELEIRIPGGWTGVATGKAILLLGADAKPADVRWMSVFVRKGDNWQVAGSQVTAISQKAP